MTRRPQSDTLIGLGLIVTAAALYWLANRGFDAMRGDLFYLADAFLHGRTWLDVRLGPNDVIPVGGRYYVPFAPFPAVALMPIVALVGPITADQLEPGSTLSLAAAGVGMCWWLLGRIGVARLSDRLWLTVLFGFSTQILWVTTRGGVWHTGHLVATILTFACLLELFGRQRAWLVGLLAGAAFLSRAPLAFAVPFYALLLMQPARHVATEVAGDTSRGRSRCPVAAVGVAGPRDSSRRSWRSSCTTRCASGHPFESGYALATLPPFLEAQRAIGLFSLTHIPMNLDYFLSHLPRRSRSRRSSGPTASGCPC